MEPVSCYHPPMPKILYYDCFAGISGDMHMAALLDAGVEEDFLRTELEKLPVSGEFELIISRDSKNGISGRRVDVKTRESRHHRNLEDITGIIREARYGREVESLALKIFRLIAEAEAAVHGKPVNEVHFHEVGAVDSIVDIVAAAVCIDALAPDRILSRPPELGGGFVQTAHGNLPVPAPATLELLKSAPVHLGGTASEATTPTGAAILAAVVDEFAAAPSLLPRTVGYGIGHRDCDIPNVLRVVLGEAAPAVGTDGTAPVVPGDAEQTVNLVIQCTIDDMNPELYDDLVERLFDDGALDVYLTPIIMKKTRPGVELTVVCTEEKGLEISETIFTSSSSIGLRIQKAEKHMLKREEQTAATPFGPVQVKTAFLNGRAVNSKAEYRDCKERAREHGVTVEEVRRAALNAVRAAEDSSTP